MNSERKKLLEPILNTFENEDIKEFAIELLNNLPEYVWHVGASSTGKYHPAYSLGEGGLMRHQMAVVRFLNFFLELEQYGAGMTSRERDLMRTAALIHDGMKSGTQEDYTKSKYTKFNHPILMAEVVRSTDGLNTSERDFIAHCIESHMGQWAFDKKTNIELPKPKDEYQKLVHLADYLASRKSLAMDFENIEAPRVESKPEDYVLTFGKHKGEKLIDLCRAGDDYVDWMEENIGRADVQNAIKAVKQKLAAELDDEL
jgi:hypothetical protein